MKNLSGGKLLFVAITFGVIAAVLAVLFLKMKEDYYRNAYQPKVKAMVTVVVPNADMVRGDVLAKNTISALRIPSEYTPAGVLLASDWRKAENRMVISKLQRGKPITWSALEGEAVDTFSENIDLGKRAKTIKISKINSFDGLLRPGDHIDLYGKFQGPKIGLPASVDEKVGNDVIFPLLENIVVLAAGKEDENGKKYEIFFDNTSADGFNMNFSMVAVQLSSRQAAKLELAQSNGDLVAVLRHPKDTSVSNVTQLTVSSLLEPDEPETVDLVLDANGKPVGRVIGDNIVDANGKIVGKMVDGKAVSFSGEVLGSVVSGVSEDDPMMRVAKVQDVIRDANGKIVGYVKDGQVVDQAGNVIGKVENGRAVSLTGETMGTVDKGVYLDKNGQEVDMSKSTAPVVSEVVRDASGKVIGRVVNGQVIDSSGKVVGSIDENGKPVGLDGESLGEIEKAFVGADGQVLNEPVVLVKDSQGNVIGRLVNGKVIDSTGKTIGELRDGKIIDANGKVIHEGVTTETTTQAMIAGKVDSKRIRVNRFYEFIAGGTAEDGITPVKKVPME